MSLQLQAATTAQLDDIARLLCEAFQALPNAAFTDRRLLHWKYFDSAAVWRRPCSFVLTEAQSVAAHCAVAPLKLVMPHEQERQEAANTVSGVCFMDWASDRHLPYAGVLLKKRLMSMTEVAIVAGGTAATRAIIPKLGFTVYGPVHTFARVVRPIRQWRTRPRTSRWKDAARVVRNTAWSLIPLGALSVEWTATPVESFAEAIDTISPALTMPEHGVDFLNYWLRCPTTRIRGYEIRRRGVRCGHFLLSDVAGQARIADLRLNSTHVRDWQMAYRLATRTAAQDETTCEVVALASTPLASAALAACGFRRRGSVPLSVYDPHGKLAGAPPLCWSFIDDDAACLNDPAYPYST
jgi:hypothetical protein